MRFSEKHWVRSPKRSAEQAFIRRICKDEQEALEIRHQRQTLMMRFVCLRTLPAVVVGIVWFSCAFAPVLLFFAFLMC